ncbi:DnaJ domain-containing protein [bacterium]|nr:DnaJ domain-containing protein [bacterium]
MPQRQHQKSKRAEGENRARTKDPYHILGIDQRANKEEIERAYKRLAAKYHPDKVTHLGKDFQELAHRKFIEIQKAYRQVLSKSKG